MDKQTRIWLLVAIILGIFLFTELFEVTWTAYDNKKFKNTVNITN